MENLSELATIYPNVKILHFHVDVKNNRLDFKVIHDEYLFPLRDSFALWSFHTYSDSPNQFQLKDGLWHVPHYGLLLAGVAGLPGSVIETARSITSKIAAKVI